MPTIVNLSCGLLLFWAVAAQAALPDVVAQALRDARVDENSVAVFVQAVGEAQPTISHNADAALNPASTMKLLTTYAGLELLGPDYRWRTEVYTDGELRDGVLEGDLILRGDGNPYFMAEDFWRLLGRLRQLGVRDIRGDLVLDDTYFAPRSDDPGAFDNEPYRAYNATPAALLTNLKSTTFYFRPHDDGQLTISAEPDLPQIRIVNEMRVSTGSCPGWRSGLDYEVVPLAAAMPAREVSIRFSGTYYASCGEHAMELSLLDAPSYVYGLFGKLWRQLGGSFDGGLRQQATPPTAVQLLVQESRPLSEIVRYINKYSNNLMARHLLLTIAAESSGLPAAEVEGEIAIKAWLASKQLDFPELVIENGAGLSRIERISAAHLGALLLAAYASPLMPELMASMPILSVDGTLRRRMHDSPAEGQAHIKTGSLDDTRAIAGYVLDATGRRWVVVFMANDARAAYTRGAQDALVEWVYRH